MNTMNKLHDSPEYLQKKSAYRQLLTVYGRKPALEALQDPSLSCFRLHLADSNKPAPVIRELEQLAKNNQVEILYHDRPSLSRISKNGKQDQGVCLDIHCPAHQDYTDFLKSHRSNSSNPNNGSTKKLRILALDRITNPQNMGMIIRSACAGNIDGILISEKGCAKLDALVIKGSAGTLFKAPILRCDQLATALQESQSRGATVVGLTGHAKQTLASFEEPDFTVYILGNETEGMSQTIENLCDKTVFIPMKNQVESLNVAVTASLLAFRGSI
ncbi:MAG: 23S rRNA (guanosine2251-2'-O)-methyltransferase [Cellvibrionaceae bacterium]|jgi:23S rRNA (guanosine2251-2'-O)-methyltransferase